MSKPLHIVQTRLRRFYGRYTPVTYDDKRTKRATETCCAHALSIIVHEKFRFVVGERRESLDESGDPSRRARHTDLPKKRI